MSKKDILEISSVTKEAITIISKHLVESSTRSDNLFNIAIDDQNIYPCINDKDKENILNAAIVFTVASIDECFRIGLVELTNILLRFFWDKDLSKVLANKYGRPVNEIESYKNQLPIIQDIIKYRAYKKSFQDFEAIKKQYKNFLSNFNLDFKSDDLCCLFSKSMSKRHPELAPYFKKDSFEEDFNQLISKRHAIVHNLNLVPFKRNEIQSIRKNVYSSTVFVMLFFTKVMSTLISNKEMENKEEIVNILKNKFV